MLCDQAPVIEPPAEKAPKKPAEKATEKKGKSVEAVQEVTLDPVEEKIRQQRYEFDIFISSCTLSTFISHDALGANKCLYMECCIAFASCGYVFDIFISSCTLSTFISHDALGANKCLYMECCIAFASCGCYVFLDNYLAGKSHDYGGPLGMT